MSGTISAYQQTAFATPIDGTAASATVVLSNDNTIRGKHNGHDADATIHVQSSLLTDRPAASIAQRLWLTTDGRRAYLDSGTAWAELAYLPTIGGTVATVTVSGSTVLADVTATSAVVNGEARVAFGASGKLRVRDFSTQGLGIDSRTTDESALAKLILAGTQIWLGGSLDTGVIVGTTDPGGSNLLRVNGTSLFAGTMQITTGGLALSVPLDFSSYGGTAIVQGGLSGLNVTDHTNSNVNLGITDAGAVAVRASVFIGATPVNVFGDTLRARTDSAASGTVECAHIELHMSAGVTGSKYALDAASFGDHATGTLGTVRGGAFGVNQTGAGTTTNAQPVVANVTVSAGVITNADNITVLSPTVAVGSIVNLTGLNIGNMTAGTSTNFAIKTGSGLVQFGDELITAASTTTRAGFRLPSGNAPTSPVDGDVWFDGSNYKGRIGGVTKTFTVS